MTAITVALLFASASPTVHSQVMLDALPIRFLVIDPEPAGARLVRNGEVLWKWPLRWARAAVLEGGGKVMIAGYPRTIAAGDVVPQTRLQFVDPTLGVPLGFCSARKTYNPVTSSLGGYVADVERRSKVGDDQTCLLDVDHDGSIDHAVMVNEALAGANIPTPVTPIAYRIEEGSLIGNGDYVQLVGRGKSFELEVYQGGDKKAFESWSYNNGTGQQSLFAYTRSYKLDDGRRAYFTPRGILYFSGYDKAGRAVSVEWPSSNNRRVIPVPDEVKVSIRPF